MTVPSSAAARVNGVVLQGQMLIDCATLVAIAVRAIQLQHDPVNARVRYLADLLSTAARDAVSVSGPMSMPDLDIAAESLAEDITTREAATLLGHTHRHASRLMPTLGARKTSAGWMIPRGAVIAHQQERTTR